MTHEELKQARLALRLTPAEAATLLDLKTTKQVYRMESAPENAIHITPPARVVRLYRAYLDGHRPDDWPERLVEEEKRRAEIRRAKG